MRSYRDNILILFLAVILCSWLAGGSAAAEEDCVPAPAAECIVAGYGELINVCRSTQGPCNSAVQPQVVQLGGPGSRSSNVDDCPGFGGH